MTENTKEIYGIGKQKVLEDFVPDKKYITILVIELTLLYLVIFGILFGLAIGILLLETGVLGSKMLLATYIIVGVGIPLYILSIVFVFPYYNSISYTLTTQEIVVNKGFLVKRTKIVP